MTPPARGGPVAAVTAVGVVGAGTMGAGIAQLALEAGHRLLLHDVDPAAVERARGRIAEGLARRARGRGLTDDAAAVETRLALARLEPVPDLEALAGGADFVVEAVIEDLALKQAVFARLDAAAPPRTILATNTSALSVGSLAAATRHPERVLGLHFFNPAPVMPLVEVVATPQTDPALVAAATQLVTAWGRTAVRSADAPGFIVNRVNRPFTLEALRILESGRGSVEGIDAALRADGFPMGPFELMDLVGIDVNLAAAGGIFLAFDRAPRFRPSPIQEWLVAAGRLGRKTGEGFYRHGEDGRALGPADDFAPTATTATTAAEPLVPEAVVERVVLAVVDEAYRALGERVAASAADVDLALRLGAGHPRGPFEQAARFGGPSGVVARLERLRVTEGDRFAPAPLLLEAAEAAGAAPGG